MKNFLIPLAVSIIVITCSQSANKETESSSIDSITNKSKYNPQVDTTYFYPADRSETKSTAIISEYNVTAIIFPIPNSYVNYFKEHSGKGKMMTDKIRRRDFKLKIDITDNKGFM